ncbi:hypothetical protein GALL_468540 [mine drainage metagenome]|uniref:Uncharacterized protein n=1 Tax=mine drainage metagenome TaxID=410659 RepID=A0A1J5PL33_9ZZZZ
MRGHRVGLQRAHRVHHVLPLGFQHGVRAVPRVATIQQQRLGPFGADRLDHGRQAVKATHLAVGLGQRLEVEIGQGIGLGGAGLDIVEFEEIGAGHMGRQALLGADAKVHLGFAEPIGHQLAVAVGDVDQRDVAGGFEIEQLMLRQALLCREARPPADAISAPDGRSGNRRLQEITPRNHTEPPVTDVAAPKARHGSRRPSVSGSGADAHALDRQAIAARRDIQFQRVKLGRTRLEAFCAGVADAAEQAVLQRDEPACA